MFNKFRPSVDASCVGDELIPAFPSEIKSEHEEDNIDQRQVSYQSPLNQASATAWTGTEQTGDQLPALSVTSSLNSKVIFAINAPQTWHIADFVILFAAVRFLISLRWWILYLGLNTSKVLQLFHFSIQQIVTMSIYGQKVTVVRHPFITDILRQLYIL